MIETTNGHMTAEQIKGIRARLGYTQERLAAAIGVSVRTVMNWEQGNGWPNAENADRLTLLDTPEQERREEVRQSVNAALTIAERNLDIAESTNNESEELLYLDVCRQLRVVHALIPPL